jgi:hypothetical protein
MLCTKALKAEIPDTALIPDLAGMVASYLERTRLPDCITLPFEIKEPFLRIERGLVDECGRPNCRCLPETLLVTFTTFKPFTSLVYFAQGSLYFFTNDYGDLDLRTADSNFVLNKRYMFATRMTRTPPELAQLLAAYEQSGYAPKTEDSPAFKAPSDRATWQVDRL